MVTSFNRKDLIVFGNYLLSEKRRELYKSHPEYQNGKMLEERLSCVNHADIENCFGLIGPEKIDEDEIYKSSKEDITGDLDFDKQHFWLDVPIAIEQGFGYLRAGSSLYKIESPIYVTQISKTISFVNN